MNQMIRHHTEIADARARNMQPVFKVYSDPPNPEREEAYAREIKNAVANEIMRITMQENNNRPPTIKREIARLMKDGRPRTCCEIIERLGKKTESGRRNVRLALSHMGRDNLLVSEPISKALTIWEAVK